MLPRVFPLLTASAAVTALVGTRIYRHGAAPDNVVAPYVTWFVVVGTPENSISETPRIDRYSVQVDCWSNNTGTGATQVETLAEAVRDALEPSAHMTGVVVNERDFDTQRYRLGLQFDFWTHRTSQPSPLPPSIEYYLALSGDMTDGNDLLLLSGDMQSGGDALVT